MREIIADKELSGAQPVQDDGADNEFIEAANDNEHLETKTRPSYKRAQPYDWTAQSQDLCHWKKGLPIWGNKICATRRHSARADAGSQNALKSRR